MLRFHSVMAMVLSVSLVACDASETTETTSPKDESASVSTPSGQHSSEESDAEETDHTGPVSKDQILAMSDEDKAEFLSFVEPTAENLPVLIYFVKDYDNVDVRLAALSALESVEDNPDVVQVIAGLLKENNVSLVLAAIDTLEFVGTEKEVAYLKPLLENNNPDIKAAAEHAIEFLQE